MKQPVVIVLLSLFVTCAAYPTAFPFESEKEPPPEIAVGNPSYAFDDSDEGGYVYRYWFSRIWNEDDVPHCVYSSGAMMYSMVAKYKTVPLSNVEKFNCTQRGNIIVTEIYPGKMMDNTKICEVGECCKEFYGKPTSGAIKVQNGAYQKFQDIYDAGQCQNWFNEAMYCDLFSNGYQVNCVENMVNPVDERLIILPCYDSLFNFFMGCNLYKMTGYYTEQESPIYHTSQTSDQNTALYSVVKTGSDHICHPYSYFYPSFLKGSTTTETSSVSMDESCGHTFSLMAFMVVASYFMT